jgi:hypothetical protein
MEERSRDIRVVSALEETEEAHGLVMKLDVLVIHRGDNAPNRLLPTKREEVFNVSM